MGRQQLRIHRTAQSSDGAAFQRTHGRRARCVRRSSGSRVMIVLCEKCNETFPNHTRDSEKRVRNGAQPSRCARERGATPARSLRSKCHVDHAGLPRTNSLGRLPAADAHREESDLRLCPGAAHDRQRPTHEGGTFTARRFCESSATSVGCAAVALSRQCPALRRRPTLVIRCDPLDDALVSVSKHKDDACSQWAERHMLAQAGHVTKLRRRGLCGGQRVVFSEHRALGPFIATEGPTT